MSIIANEIYALMRKASNLKMLVMEYQNSLSEEKLLEELKALDKINEMIKKEPLLKEALEGMQKVLKMMPSEIIKEIKFKDNVEIRAFYEELKREKGVGYGRVEFGTGHGSNFKMEIKSDGESRDTSFSSHSILD